MLWPTLPFPLPFLSITLEAIFTLMKIVLFSSWALPAFSYMAQTAIRGDLPCLAGLFLQQPNHGGCTSSAALISMALTPKIEATRALAPSQQYNCVSPGLHRIWMRPPCYSGGRAENQWSRKSLLVFGLGLVWSFLLVLKRLWILISSKNPS